MDCRTIVKSLRMENFGCFRDKTVKFDSGLNQIIGANESGKSTLIKALLTSLFDDGATRKKAVASLGNWSVGQPFRLTLEFSVGDKSYTLIRDYGTGRNKMTDSDGIIYEGKTIGEKLALYFGTTDRNLFESIFCFSSDSPSAPESSKERLRSAVEKPVFYGFDRVRADRYLVEEIKRLENPRAHGPRELDVIAGQISSRLQEKSEFEKRMEALNENKQELDEVRCKLEEHEEAISRLEKEIEGATAYQELNGKMANLEDRLQVHLGNYSRAAQVSEDLERVEKELVRLNVPGLEEMTNISEKSVEINNRVEESKQSMDTFIARRKKANRGFGTATLMLVLLCLAYVFQQNGYIQIGTAADILPYTIPVMILVWLSRMGVYVSQFYKKKKATSNFRERVGELDSYYAELNRKYGSRAADPVRALEETIQRQQALEISAENLRNTIDVLSENKGLDYLNQIKEQIETEVAQLNQELGSLAEFVSAASKLADIKEELISRRVRANALRERSALLNERCSIIDTLKKSIETVDEEVEILKRKHNDISERLEILKITRNAINRAADQLIEDTFEAYGASASSFLASLTEKRYNQLRFCRETSRFEVKIGAADNWYQISDTLSSSTRDCIYLALRMAGVALLSAEFVPPVVFDQAETRMDSGRRKAFFSIMKQIVEKRQVICIGLKKTEQWGEAHLIEFEKKEFAYQSSDAV